MKKLKSILTLILLMSLISCETPQNKSSRLIIEKYTRKLESITENIVKSRNEEGSQSRLTLNNFFERYFSSLEEFSNDLNFETISDKYIAQKENLLEISDALTEYLNYRKEAIVYLSEATSSYSSAIDDINDYDDYKFKAKYSSYSSSTYLEYANDSYYDYMKEEINFLSSRREFLDDCESINSIYSRLDSLTSEINQVVEETRIEQSFKLPDNLNDTIDDWLLSTKKTIRKLEIPDID